MEIDLTAKKPNQDNCEEDYDPDDPNPKDTVVDNPTVPSLLNSVPQLHKESRDDFLHTVRITFARSTIVTTEDQPAVPSREFRNSHGATN